MASTSNWTATERDSLLYNKNGGKSGHFDSEGGYSQLAARNESSSAVNRHHRNVHNQVQRRHSIRRLMRDYPRPMPIKWTKALGKTGYSFTIILVILFILLILFKVWFNLTASSTYVIQVDPLESTSKLSNIHDKSELVLVNVLFRHGDRAPEFLNHLDMDQLSSKVNQIWPRGLQNLTDTGRLRMFKIGLELSRLYRFPLSAYDSSSLLALSSDFPRCIESLQTMLRGFYNPETTTLEESLDELVAIEESCKEQTGHRLHEPSEGPLCNLLANSSSNFATDEWKRVHIDTQSLITLRSKFVIENCPKFNKTNCSIYNDLTRDSNLTSLPGFADLQKRLSLSSGDKFNYDLANFYGSLNPIIKSASIPAVRKALLAHIKWITQPVNINHKDNNRHLTLLNTYEALNMMADTICAGQGLAGQLQNYPIVSSLVESQSMALGGPATNGNLSLSSSKSIYKGKKIIFYATHDTIIESLLSHLDIRKTILGGMSYLDAFKTAIESSEANANRHHELNGLIGGFKRAEPGASVVFELWKTRNNTTDGGSLTTKRQYPYVKLLIYQRQDPFHQRIQFERVKLGSICVESFSRIYQNQAALEKFYQDAPEFFNRDFDCPFDLWRNITNDRLMTNEIFKDTCYK